MFDILCGFKANSGMQVNNYPICIGHPNLGDAVDLFIFSWPLAVTEHLFWVVIV